MPTITSMGAGAIRATVPTNWDRDDSLLTLPAAPGRQGGQLGRRGLHLLEPADGRLVDTGLTAGTTYKYQIRTRRLRPATTPSGNRSPSPRTAAGPAISAFAQLVAAQGASTYWRLGEATGTVYDWAGTNDGTPAPA